MRVRLVSLEALLDLAGGTKEEFTATFPGVFLLAMGFVSAEVLRSGAGGTSAVRFAVQPRHDPSLQHPLAGHAFFVEAGAALGTELTIGRSADCEITVPDTSVSDQHCRIRLTAGGVTAIDFGSTNGTSLNLARLAPGTPALLGDEDILTLGRYSFQVLSAATLHSALGLLQTLQKE